MKSLLGILIASLLASAAWADANDTYNFRFGPVGAIVGAAMINLDVKITPNWTLGPELSYWNYKTSFSSDNSADFAVNSFSVGARGNWFRNGVYTDGLYVGPSVGYFNMNVSTTDSSNSNTTGKSSGAAVGCLVGYAWYWNSFNMMLGGGAAISLGKSSVTVTDSSGNAHAVDNSNLGLAGEYSLGWTF